ncbi:DUF2125 domain-containing protein [Prosthecomicrobium pneumaticum]|uniref:DUF2125 domain-containing protein n=1 Tax=Prosthecomicrobium pneumaticum TaxID=81895 RepID=A0A7W9FQK4_9HYPH|nr:DUF2125 domain-containing protein [Prosthecomicrobium pneumaticum]MBB5754968.1 hypothetical protein [Prosthecomicrobium pneumaticum]
MTQSEAEDPAAGPRPRSRTARKIRLLFVAVIAVMLLWTALWFGGTHYGARELDRMIAAAGERGDQITCLDRRIGGFPFQLDLSCSKTAFSSAEAGVSATLGASEAVTLVYDPMHVILAAAGPLEASAGDATLEANWARLRSSVRVDTERLRRISLVLDQPDIAVVLTDGMDPLRAKATHSELHLGGETPDRETLELAFQSQGLTLDVPDGPPIPEADVSVAVDLPGALPRKNGPEPLAGWLAAGRRIGLQFLDLSVAGFRVRAEGDLAFDEKGRLSGTMALRFAGLDTLPDLVAQFAPDERDTVAQGAAALAAFTRRVEADGVTWQEATLAIDKGVVRAGLIPLGRLPRITLPQP